MIRKLLAFILTALLGSSGFAQPASWEVPAEAKEKVCSFKFTQETVKSGESVFQKNCKSCHGDPGKQNFAKITPPPGDPASAIFQKQTDGEIFYRVTTGKAPMPTFGAILSEDERWQVIAYIRSFNSSYVQPEPAVKALAGSKNLTLSIRADEKLKKILVTATENVKGRGTLPASKVGIQLFVKRYFGSLKLGDEKYTNSVGIATFDFPSDLPGGKVGIIDITASITDASGMLNARPVTASLPVAKAVEFKSLTDARAMWSVRSKAPVWLILTFSLSVITVWGFIFYILFSLKKLKESN